MIVGALLKGLFNKRNSPKTSKIIWYWLDITWRRQYSRSSEESTRQTRGGQSPTGSSAGGLKPLHAQSSKSDTWLIYRQDWVFCKGLKAQQRAGRCRVTHLRTPQDKLTFQRKFPVRPSLCSTRTPVASSAQFSSRKLSSCSLSVCNSSLISCLWLFLQVILQRFILNSSFPACQMWECAAFLCCTSKQSDSVETKASK